MNERQAAVIAQAREFVRARLTDEKSGHDWAHIERVSRWARYLAAEEDADAFRCELAALFHDLADDKVVASKEQGLSEIAAWLRAHGTDGETAQAVLDIIATMSFREGGKRMGTPEGRVVQDADRLDAIGAIGIARAFYYAGSHGHSLHDPAAPPRGGASEERERREPGTAIQHFHEKLLKLKGLLNTAGAKREAERRHAVLAAYLEQFYREWDAPAASPTEGGGRA